MSYERCLFMSKKIVLMDGAVGTSLWEKATDKVPVWRYSLENPKIVRELHEDMVQAGADIVLANTFAANAAEIHRTTSYSVQEVVSTAMKIAQDTVNGRAKVALAVGPLTGLLKPYGDIPIQDACDMFEEQIGSGIPEKPDCIYIQTFMDLEMFKIAIRAADKYDIPILCSMSFMGANKSGKRSKMARTLMGNTVKQIADAMAEFKNIKGLGLNCSLGPVDALPIIDEFVAASDIPIIFKPNAGKPTVDENGLAGMAFDIETFAEDVSMAVEKGATYIGGCCGSNGKYIKRLGERIKERLAAMGE